MKAIRIIIVSLIMLVEFDWVCSNGLRLLIIRDWTAFPYAKPIIYIYFVTGIILIIFSILSIYWIVKARKRVVRRLVFTVIPVFFLMMAISGLMDDDFEVVALAGVIAIVLSIPLIVEIVTSLKRNNTQRVYDFSKFMFVEDNVKWHWDKAAEEYSKLVDKAIDDFSDEDKDLVWTYAATYMGYMLAWLIKKNKFAFVDGEHESQYYKDYLMKIADEKESLIEFLNKDLHGSIRGEGYISDDKVRFFLYSYYVKGTLCGQFNTRLSYNKDFYAVIGGYCKEFSWENYYKLEECIDSRFDLYVNGKEETFDIEHGSIIWESMNAELSVCSSENVSLDYVELCKNYLKENDAKLSEIISKALVECCNEEITEEYIKSDAVEFAEMCIFFPKNHSIPAFALGGEWDVDEEHGFAISIKGDKVIEVSYRRDISTPWFEYD